MNSNLPHEANTETRGLGRAFPEEKKVISRGAVSHTAGAGLAQLSREVLSLGASDHPITRQLIKGPSFLCLGQKSNTAGLGSRTGLAKMSPGKRKLLV